MPRSAYPEVNVSAEHEVEHKSETLTSCGMSTLIASSPVASGGVSAFAEPVTKKKSKAPTQPLQLYDRVLPGPLVDVAAESGRSKSSATPTLALSLLGSSSFNSPEVLDDAWRAPDSLLIQSWPFSFSFLDHLAAHPGLNLASTAIPVTTAITCTSFTITTRMLLMASGAGTHTPDDSDRDDADRAGCH